MSSLPLKADSAFNAGELEGYLHTMTIPMRLACLGSNGFPLVASHWYRYQDGELFSALHQNSLVARHLRENPRCSFEIAADTLPYRGARGQGIAHLHREGAGECLEQLIVRYLGDTDSKLAQWLLSRRNEEYMVRITPRWITSWDFTERMGR
ncbi:MAG: pyridoxamine 5'-phosphate oxidase [Porticoccaceae bacterium]|nr:pyridoxamine 5'-phosphate oxidase [Porticoccaceae bacterium]